MALSRDKDLPRTLRSSWKTYSTPKHRHHWHSTKVTPTNKRIYYCNWISSNRKLYFETLRQVQLTHRHERHIIYSGPNWWPNHANPHLNWTTEPGFNFASWNVSVKILWKISPHRQSMISDQIALHSVQLPLLINFLWETSHKSASLTSQSESRWVKITANSTSSTTLSTMKIQTIS